jgi:hypothetical protein
VKTRALQYFMHDGPAAFRFEMAGDLDKEGARRLEQDWRTASSVIGDRALIVDMTFLTGADKEGRSLLAEWYANGAHLVAKSKISQELAEAILGGPLPEFNYTSDAGTGRTWLPFRTSFSASQLFLMLLLSLLLIPPPLSAANLHLETVGVWDDYLDSVRSTLQDRIRPGGSFLWTYENSERLAKVRDGEIVVAPAQGQNPRNISGGLIHHWLGAAFIANAKLDETLEVVRDYDRYKDYYRPSVIESKMVTRNDLTDRFFMLVMNKTFLLDTALAADYKATNVRLDNDRFYSVAETTRIQEIAEYGHPGAHKIPEGEGTGFIWKLFDITRLEQCKGGVYVEIETVALSRDIPAAMRLVVDPIVRRMAHNSLLTFIQLTEHAVEWNAYEAGRSANEDSKNNTSALARVQ